MNRASAALITALATTPALQAQDFPTGPPNSVTTVWSGYGRPLPTCDAVFISELGFNVSAAGAMRFPYVVLDFGALRNVSSRLGLGGSFFLGAGETYILAAKTARPLVVG